jgi:hypothetical protein
MNYDKKVSEYIASASEEQMPILETLRAIVHDTVPDVSEAVKWGFAVFTTKKNFAYLRFAKKHITLGFYNIDKLIDPNNLLEGEGVTLRHIKIKKAEEVKTLPIAAWLEQITS